MEVVVGVVEAAPGASAVPLVSRWSRDIEKSPGTILAGHAERILTCVSQCPGGLN